MLLILSNDIHPNPGPRPKPLNSKGCNNLKQSNKPISRFKCSTCKEDIDIEMKHLLCSTCNKRYHISCQQIESSNLNHNKESFQWICSTKKCPPNLQKSFIQTNLISQNKFSALNEVLENQVNSDVSKSNYDLDKEPKQLSFYELQNILMFQELPKLSPEDYKGKCHCRVCHKEVTFKNRAMSIIL